MKKCLSIQQLAENQDTEFGKKELSRNDFLSNFEISSRGYDHKIGILS